MKLGIFDSGLGGLVIARSIREALPDIDMLYYGDTLHLPYGNRSDAAIIEYTKRAMVVMFERDCQLIVMACNTASAAALRYLQQNWLQEHYPGRNIIGVVVPTLEEAVERGHRRLGLIATNYIVGSGIYKDELKKLAPEIQLFQAATPLLVPLIENGGRQWTGEVLAHYLAPLMDEGIECLMLGCTHYPALKDEVREVVGPNVSLLSQDDLIPSKLTSYLKRHPEYSDKIGINSFYEFYVSDLTDHYLNAARRIYGDDIEVTCV